MKLTNHKKRIIIDISKIKRRIMKNFVENKYYYYYFQNNVSFCKGR